MKHPVVILIAAAIVFAGLSGSARGQHGDSTCSAFFATPGAALIFGVSKLNLTGYEGGIGVGYVVSPRLFWRFSVDFSTYSQKTENEWYPYQTGVRNAYSVGCSIAPMYVLLHENPLVLYCGPKLTIGRRYDKDSDETRDSASTRLSWYESRGWSAGGEAFFGSGIAVTDRILLAGEYRIYATFSRGTSTHGSNLKSDPSHSSESTEWTTGSYIVFSLAVKF